MADRIPFDEDTMTLIMGLGGPEKPGQHGRTMIPAPENKAIDIITQIRDLCEDFLQTADKEEKPKEGDEGEEMPEEDMEE
jgi:hypothetical protein